MAFWRIISEYFEWVFANTSTHGGNWFAKIQNVKLKIIFGIAILTLQITMLVVFVGSLFKEKVDIYTVTDWNTDIVNIDFPNITVCNPRMFDVQKVEGAFISKRTFINIVHIQLYI